MENENIFLLHAFFLGIYITFIYDLFRIMRKAIPHNTVAVSLEDLGFWTYCTVKVFLLMYRESNGTLRWFAVLGAVLGMLLYRKTVSPFLVKYAALLLRKCLELLGRCLRILFAPILLLGKKLKGHAKKMSRRTAERGRRGLKKRLTFLLKVLRMIV